MDFLLTGASGLLGRAFMWELSRRGCSFLATSRTANFSSNPRIEALDLGDMAELELMIEEASPKWLLNCAAYTAVDRAEADKESAFFCNTSAVGQLAALSARYGLCVLHISTDYVFGNSKKRTPFTEGDRPKPCGVYGWSKFLGEELLRRLNPDGHFILRTSWLFGGGNPNFVDTMLRLSESSNPLRVVDDQIGSPTYTPWLACAALDLIEADARGTYHSSCAGACSWFDFAEEIFSQSAIDRQVLRQSSAQSQRPAPRPAYSVLSCKKLEEKIGSTRPPWREALGSYLSDRASPQSPGSP